MIHLILIDPLEKLTLKKDSTIQLAIALKKERQEVYLLFENNLYFSNNNQLTLECYDFTGEFDSNGISPCGFSLGNKKTIEVSPQCNLHMRLDPPFDSRYLRILWILSAIKDQTKCRVTNGPDGIAISNEKLISYLSSDSVKSYVGSSLKGFSDFCEEMKSEGNDEIVIKPLDLYQGIGVEKLSLSTNLEDVFKERVTKYGGAIVAQPYLKSVEKGEVRSIYYAGKHLGSILKTPKKGDFISNIANGATFDSYDLTKEEKDLCDREAERLNKIDLPWVAFDLLEGKMQEMNITCPGLLVEVSIANNKNLAFDLIKLLID